MGRNPPMFGGEKTCCELIFYYIILHHPYVKRKNLTPLRENMRIMRIHFMVLLFFVQSNKFLT